MTLSEYIARCFALFIIVYGLCMCGACVFIQIAGGK